MKKKIFSVFFSFLILVSLCAFPAHAYGDLGYFPLSYSYWITYDNYGTPIFNFDSYSMSEIPILGFDIIIYPKYENGQDVYYNGDNYKYAYLRDEYIELYEYFYGSIPLTGFYGASDYTQVRLDTVYFANGETWSYSQPNYYEEANFSIGNDADAAGNYVVNPATHEVQLFEYSYSAYQRSWYIWNDNVGWVWFSNEIDPVCTVWTKSASIKLVINNNPNMYKVLNFTIKEAPYFNILCQNTGKLVSSLTENEYFTMPWAQEAPYTFALWDASETLRYRDWYIWDENLGDWVWFSNHRGPYCYIWQKGEQAIKLVHNKNDADSSIFVFNIY